MTQLVKAIKQAQPSVTSFEEIYVATRAWVLAIESLRSGALYDV